jgi:hypothetical protein
MTMPSGSRDKYYTACGRVMILGLVDDNPAAKRCAKCVRNTKPTPDEQQGGREERERE